MFGMVIVALVKSINILARLYLSETGGEKSKKSSVKCAGNTFLGKEKSE